MLFISCLPTTFSNTSNVQDQEEPKEESRKAHTDAPLTLHQMLVRNIRLLGITSLLFV